MRKRLLPILAALSTLLLLGQLAAQAYFLFAGPGHEFHPWPSTKQQAVTIAPNGLWLTLALPGGPTVQSPVFADPAQATGWGTRAGPPVSRFLGFACGWSTAMSINTVPGGYQALVQARYYVLLIPHLFLSLLLLILPASWLLRVLKLHRLRRLAAQGHCPHCGYDLRATPARCPECGAAIPGPSSTMPDPR